jgi:signal transduction histidine kinase/CheY-like chemotaxis protein
MGIGGPAACAPSGPPILVACVNSMFTGVAQAASIEDGFSVAQTRLHEAGEASDDRSSRAQAVAMSETVPDDASHPALPSPSRTEITRLQRNLAVCASASLLVAGAVATPFAAVRMLEVPGYMTAFGSAMIVINILLAALLFSRGAIEESGDATRLGTAYLFVAVVFVPLVASFPGGVMTASLIGSAASSVWLWSFWHAGFGLCIIRYAWLARRPGRAASLTAAILGVVAAVAALTVVSTSLLPFLPSALSEGRTLFSGESGLIPVVVLAVLAVAFALVCRLRARNLEQLSLVVAMAAALFDVWLTWQGSSRFSLGWYLSKCGSLVTSLVVLISLLHEVTLLHRRAAADNRELARLARKLTLARDRSDRASGAKSRFLAGMSHELRTPLNGILGYAQLLHMEGGLTAGQSARVDAMRSAGAHLLEMINSVLDLSQIEAERLELRAVETDARMVAGACLDLVRPAAERKALALRLVAGADVPGLVTVDPVRLRQVLLNLLGNAVKFSDAGSIEMRLLTAGDGRMLRVEVADTGRGIPAARRPLLFQSFERLGAGAAGEVEGAGLGLALSARLAALMGGRLGHDDNPGGGGVPGGGSVFWLELPLRSDPVRSVVHAAPEQAAAAAAARPLRVLVVDDVDMNRDIAACFLRMAGLQVAVAEDGAEAIRAVAGEDWNVVLMDVRMPLMDGLEATRRIRALSGPRGLVPVVALTAQVFAEQIDECRRAGMDASLSKPFTPESLLAAVRSAAAGDARGCGATAREPAGADGRRMALAGEA